MEEREAIYLVAVEKIIPNPFQPRQHFDPDGLRELAESIRQYGILEPLIVSVRELESPQGLEATYELIAGERRLEAAKLIGLQVVPVMIKRVSEKAKLEIALIENLQRRDLNPIEKARGFSRLIDEFALTQREVAARMGKSREYVANALRLLNLPERAQEALRRGELGESQARLLLSLTDLVIQEQLLSEMLSDRLTVREAQARINTYQLQQQERARSVDSTSPVASVEAANPKFSQSSEGVIVEATVVELMDFASIEQQLEEVLGTKVKVQKTHGGLKLEINFYSTEELEQVMLDLAARSGKAKPSDPKDERLPTAQSTEEIPTKPAMKPLEIFQDLPDEPSNDFSI